MSHNMKTYLDLQAIDYPLKVHLELEMVGTPDFTLTVDGQSADYLQTEALVFDYEFDLTKTFAISIELKNKDYYAPEETAVMIKTLSIDNTDIFPRYGYLAEYDNDHGFTDATNYLGFNGKWTLTIDRPFYRWLHKHTGQGWLLE